MKKSTSDRGVWVAKNLLPLLLALAGCSDPTDRYTGTATVKEGVCSAQARVGATMPVTLVLRGSQATFAPNDGVLQLTGRNTNGQVRATAAGTGGEAARFTSVFEGTVKDNTVRGQFGSPRCRADVVMTRQ